MNKSKSVTHTTTINVIFNHKINEWIKRNPIINHGVLLSDPGKWMKTFDFVVVGVSTVVDLFFFYHFVQMCVSLTPTGRDVNREIFFYLLSIRYKINSIKFLFSSLLVKFSDYRRPRVQLIWDEINYLKFFKFRRKVKKKKKNAIVHEFCVQIF